jgi:hypothetical protein
METIGTGLVLIGNGLLEMGAGLVSWMTLVGAAATVSAYWLARMETAELDRQGTKPKVVRH